MHRLWIIPGAAIFALCVQATSGCGYSTRRLTDFPAAKTVGVLPFTNTGFRRDLELVLTQAVVREVRARTDFAIAHPSRADLVIRGATTAQESVTGLSPGDDVFQRRLVGTLDVEVVDRARDTVVRRARLVANEEFRPLLAGEGLETSAREEWARHLAEQVAQLLERGF